MPARVTEVKCKRCRKVLFTEECTPLLTAHGEVRTNSPHIRCGTGTQEYCLYVALENMPTWIHDLVEQEFWTKGKIHCPNCRSRLGSFNFVNPGKCDCGEFVTPPVRLIHCKVDRLYDKHSQPPLPPMARGFRVPERQNPLAPMPRGFRLPERRNAALANDNLGILWNDNVEEFNVSITD